jgi:hypothetical protein
MLLPLLPFLWSLDKDEKVCVQTAVKEALKDSSKRRSTGSIADEAKTASKKAKHSDAKDMVKALFSK